MAEEHLQQLGSLALSRITESESEAEEQERIRPKAETTSAEIANINQQHVRRGAATQIPSISPSEEREAGILEDMVDQLPQVPDTPIAGSQQVWFMEPLHQTPTLMVGGNGPLKVPIRIEAQHDRSNRTQFTSGSAIIYKDP